MSQHTALGFLAGGGELGERIRAKDWAATPLGPPAAWPQSLRSALSILLPSKAQIVLFWGPELITLYNDAYRPVLGAKHPHALGLPVRETWSELWERGLSDMFGGVLRTGEAFQAKDRPFYMERHGFPEETFFDVSYDPVRDESGAVGGVFCIVGETTGRVLGERRLEVLRDLAGPAGQARTVEAAGSACLRVLAGASYDVPFALLYRFAGERARLLATAGCTRGHPCCPDELPARDGRWPLAEGGLVDDLAQRFAEVPTGPWPEPPARALVLPIADRASAAPLGALVLGISARLPWDAAYGDFFELIGAQVATALANARAAEAEQRRTEALAELDRAKTLFFSNVSHEFRTPLTLMLGPVEDALADGGLPPDQRTRLELVRRSGLRLQKLVNTLLDFARIEAGRAQAVFVPVDLAAVTADLASNFRSAVDKAGLRLLVDCPPLAEPAWVDPDMWEKVVLNLLSNAFKFTLAGEIAVTLRQEGPHIVLAVRDTGTGIPADELPHVFERFRRVDGARGRSQEGSGIGLALVQELVHMHGATITAASVPGRGSTFTVTLQAGHAHLPPERVATERRAAATGLGAAPFVEEALRWLPEVGAVTVLDAEAVVPAAQAAARPRILWADDNADMRDYVRRALAPAFEVEAVADGEAALAAARRRRPDLVLADVMMPRLDGFGVLAALRADPATRSLPVVLLSARAGEEARLEGLRAGADDYLVKPFHARELVARISARLELNAARARARRSDELLRTFADTAPAILWTTAPDGTCTFLSRGWYEFTGQTEADALGRGWTEAVHPEDRADAARVFQAANERCEPFHLDYRLRRHDGVYRWAIDAGHPRWDEDGEYLGFVGSVIDVHERKQAEDALRASEARYRAIVEGQAEMVCRFQLDGAILFANGAYARACGTTPEAIVGRTFWEFVPAQDRPEVAAMLQRLTPAAPEVRIENRFVANGEERWTLWTNRALRFDEGGRPLEAQSAGIDITDRRRAEEALQEEARTLETLNRVGRMLAAELELDRIVQAVTDAGTELCGAQFGAFFYNVRDEGGESYQLFALTGAPREAFERFGMPRNTAVFAPTFAGEGPVRLADVTQDPRYGRSPPHHGMPAGHLPVRSYLAVPVVSRSGEVHGGLFFGHAQPGVFTARSERLLVGVAAQAAIAIDNAGLYDRSRRLVAELRDVDRRKDEFLAILSHELRNPLAPIRNAVALLELGDADRALRQQARAVLDRQVRHLVRLVDDLLDVSRISRGVIELKQDRLLLGELVASAVETSRPLVERHGHELRLDLPPVPVALHGDAVRLAQALANLLNNAALYTPPGGRIELAARLANGSVVIDVRDNGIGVAAETLPYLFDMFRRGAHGQQNPTGFGVGLALARRLVEMHGGSLTAASEGPGKGAVFTLRLPAKGATA